MMAEEVVKIKSIQFPYQIKLSENENIERIAYSYKAQYENEAIAIKTTET